MLKMGFRQFHKALPWTRKTPKRKATEALNGFKIDSDNCPDLIV